MPEIAQIERMSVTERVQLKEWLWEARRLKSGEISSPEWHWDILAERKARARRGEAKFLTLDQLRTRLGRNQSGAVVA